MKYTVVAIEKFCVQTTYFDVEAASAEQAEALCKEGHVGYDEKEILEGDEEWLETLEIEEQ